MPRTSLTARSLAAALCLAVGAVGLAACTAEPEPTPTPTAPPTTSEESASPTPSGPELVPDGSADDNLPYFTEIVDGVWAAGEPDSISGRAYIDALTDAGFDRGAMEVTQDVSTVGNPAESIQFSVRWGENCLVGQVGPATGDPYATVVPVLGTSTCLLGETRPIDW